MNLRHRACAAFQAALAAADPGPATSAALTAEPQQPDLILAAGKAAIPMARAALAACPPPRHGCLIATNPENATNVAGAQIFPAAHPLPDATGLAAAKAFMSAARALGQDETALVLISGGASAMLPLPIEGVSLDDKIALNALMLGADLDIGAMNLIRQSISQIKGGGLARAAAPAQLRSLILSDVPGDDLRIVASGPTMPPIGTPEAAAALLRQSGLWDRLPASIGRALLHPRPQPATSDSAATLIGSNTLSIQAAQTALSDFTLHPLPYPLTGPVGQAAEMIAKAARNTPTDRPVALVTGGETTVELKGTGRGGRNQELALRVALALDTQPLGRDWLFLSAGTDGRDGPTDAAGGFADPGTFGRIRAAELDPLALLANNDSYTALAAADDLLITGATGTNVGDGQILLMAASAPK